MTLDLNRKRLLLVIGFLGVAAGAVFWGQRGHLPQAAAQAPATPQIEPPPANLVPTANGSSEYSQRVVAYMFGNIPITREQLGEYLIAREGVDRLPNMVNKMIIEHVCRQKGIEVTAAEIEADYAQTLKDISGQHGKNINSKEFAETVLKPYHKTLYEWKEDVIRPRILLTKLCRERVQVTENDLKMAFEAYHGPKVQCRMIMWPLTEKTYVFATIYPKIRDSEAEFETVAKHQFSANLAAKGGRMEPFGRHTTANDELEKMAFALQTGEVSRVLETPQGLVVLKCDGHIPADTNVTLAQVRDKLSKEIFDKKLQLEIPNYFKELSAQANPQLFLKGNLTEWELIQNAKQETQSAQPKSAPVGAGSH